MAAAQNKSTFSKDERLCNRQRIAALFAGGQSFNEFPYKIIYQVRAASGEPAPAQVLISIPKRNFRKAVQRNMLKRLFREAYRKNKHALYELLATKQRYCEIAFIYTGKHALPLAVLEEKIILSLQRIIKAHE